jgi:hypothetical protein
MKDELESIEKEVLVACSKESHEESRLGYPAFRARFEPEVSRIQVRNRTARLNLLISLPLDAIFTNVMKETINK